MNQIVLDVLEGLRASLAADARIEQDMASLLVDALSKDVIPPGEEIVEIVRSAVSGAEE